MGEVVELVLDELDVEKLEELVRRLKSKGSNEERG